MLAPPTASEALQSLDPTKIKNRQFSKATGRDEVSKDTSLWTETPAERQARLAEELSGKRKRPNATAPDEGDESAQKRRKMQNELRKEIDDHNVRLVFWTNAQFNLLIIVHRKLHVQHLYSRCTSLLKLAYLPRKMTKRSGIGTETWVPAGDRWIQSHGINLYKTRNHSGIALAQVNEGRIISVWKAYPRSKSIGYEKYL